MTADGLHDSLLITELEPLPQAERLRFAREFSATVRPLVECVAASLAGDDDEPDPPMRWSPWMRGRLRCMDHAGHEQRTFRMRAAQAHAAGDPLWRCWHALAESRHLAEAISEMENNGG
jgi:hypothetical protein